MFMDMYAATCVPRNLTLTPDVKWYRMEQRDMLAVMTDTPGHLISYYVYILLLCCVGKFMRVIGTRSARISRDSEFLVMHVTIRAAVSWLLRRQYVIFKASICGYITQCTQLLS